MKKQIFKRLSFVVLSAFFLQVVVPQQFVRAQTVADLPVPGTLVPVSDEFAPALLKGLILDSGNPFQFNFILDTGFDRLEPEDLSKESNRLIKYFLAALTIPEDEQWVNLSPYEKDRIIPEEFGITEMGRDLLAQDYLLKQFTASLMNPEKELGEKFWERVYQKAYELYGTSSIPVNTFNKVWIVPDEALVFTENKTALILKTHLKVMLEQDYVALRAQQDDPFEEIQTEIHKEGALVARALKEMTTPIIREVFLPEIEREVNEGENFSRLRQVFHAVILAKWYKENLKQTLLNRKYADQNKVTGVDVEDKDIKNKIYQQYLTAFKAGVYHLIKEEYDPQSQTIIPRKYFLGGTVMKFGNSYTTDRAMLETYQQRGRLVQVASEMQLPSTFVPVDQDAAMMGKYRDLVGENKRLPTFTTMIDSIASLSTGQEPRYVHTDKGGNQHGFLPVTLNQKGQDLMGLFENVSVSSRAYLMVFKSEKGNYNGRFDDYNHLPLAIVVRDETNQRNLLLDISQLFTFHWHTDWIMEQAQGVMRAGQLSDISSWQALTLGVNESDYLVFPENKATGKDALNNAFQLLTIQSFNPPDYSNPLYDPFDVRPHQEIFSPTDPASMDFQRALAEKRNIFKGKSVHVLGPGVGVDVLYSLYYGASSVSYYDTNPAHNLLTAWNVQYARDTGQIPQSGQAVLVDGIQDADLYLFNTPGVETPEFIRRKLAADGLKESQASRARLMYDSEFKPLFEQLENKLKSSDNAIAIWRLLIGDGARLLPGNQLDEYFVRVQNYLASRGLAGEALENVPDIVKDGAHPNIFMVRSQAAQQDRAMLTFPLDQQSPAKQYARAIEDVIRTIRGLEPGNYEPRLIARRLRTSTTRLLRAAQDDAERMLRVTLKEANYSRGGELYADAWNVEFFVDQVITFARELNTGEKVSSLRLDGMLRLMSSIPSRKVAMVNGLKNANLVAATTAWNVAGEEISVLDMRPFVRRLDRAIVQTGNVQPVKDLSDIEFKTWPSRYADLDQVSREIIQSEVEIQGKEFKRFVDMGLGRDGSPTLFERDDMLAGLRAQNIIPEDYQLLALDQDARIVRQARGTLQGRRVAAPGLYDNIQLREGDFFSLRDVAAQEGKFDLIWGLNVLYHNNVSVRRESRQVIEEVLSPGGIFVEQNVNFNVFYRLNDQGQLMPYQFDFDVHAFGVISKRVLLWFTTFRTEEFPQADGFMDVYAVMTAIYRALLNVYYDEDIGLDAGRGKPDEDLFAARYERFQSELKSLLSDTVGVNIRFSPDGKLTIPLMLPEGNNDVWVAGAAIPGTEQVIPAEAYNVMRSRRLQQNIQTLKARLADPTDAVYQAREEMISGQLDGQQFLPLDEHKKFLRQLGEQTSMRGDVIVNAFNEADVYTAAAMNPASRDVVAVGRNPFGSSADVNKFLAQADARYLAGYQYAGFDWVDETQNIRRNLGINGLGGLAVARVETLLNGEIEGLHYFTYKDGQVKFYGPGQSLMARPDKNAVIVYRDRESGERKRFWYIQKDLFKYDQEFSALMNNIDFQSVLIKAPSEGIFETEGHGKRLSMAQQRGIEYNLFSPAKAKKARIVHDERDNKKGDSSPHNIWKMGRNPRKVILAELAGVSSRTHQFGYSHSFVYHGDAENIKAFWSQESEDLWGADLAMLTDVADKVTQKPLSPNEEKLVERTVAIIQLNAKNVLDQMDQSGVKAALDQLNAFFAEHDGLTDIDENTSGDIIASLQDVLSSIPTSDLFSKATEDIVLREYILNSIARFTRTGKIRAVLVSSSEPMLLDLAAVNGNNYSTVRTVASSLSLNLERGLTEGQPVSLDLLKLSVQMFNRSISWLNDAKNIADIDLERVKADSEQGLAAFELDRHYQNVLLPLQRLYAPIQAAKTQDGPSTTDAAILGRNVGGIDMNTDILKLKTQGAQIEIPIPADPGQWDAIQIEGLTPFIINITPINNLPLLFSTVREQSDKIAFR
ncbi:MAG: class I SAM-dependent methyltransferase [Candidatus Omnitrophica bacterium]|nr:class I SAM-dependent methyltransferase [Candidatus Omnitrophota bacterium]